MSGFSTFLFLFDYFFDYFFFFCLLFVCIWFVSSFCLIPLWKLAISLGFVDDFFPLFVGGVGFPGDIGS